MKKLILLSILVPILSLSCDKDDNLHLELEELSRTKCMGCKKVERPNGVKTIYK